MSLLKDLFNNTDGNSYYTIDIKNDKVKDNTTNNILYGCFLMESVPESKKKVVSKLMYHTYKQNKGKEIKSEEYKKMYIDYLLGTEKKYGRKKNHC